MIDAVIRDNLRKVTFHDTDENYRFYPAFDTVVENISYKFVDDGVIIRGEKIQHDFMSIDGNDKMYDTFEEARKVWRKNSIVPVYETRWHTNFKSIFSPRYESLVYKTKELVGWRRESKWAVLQETIPVEIFIPNRVPLFSYTDEMTINPDDSKEILQG